MSIFAIWTDCQDGRDLFVGDGSKYVTINLLSHHISLGTCKGLLFDFFFFERTFTPSLIGTSTTSSNMVS